MAISFLKLWGGGGENNLVKSSISDQCCFYAKCNKNAITRACFLNFSGSNITHSKSVARCVAIIMIFLKIINIGTFFKTKSDQNNTSKHTRLHQSFQNFLQSRANLFHFLRKRITNSDKSLVCGIVNSAISLHLHLICKIWTWWSAILNT